MSHTVTHPGCSSRTIEGEKRDRSIKLHNIKLSREDAHNLRQRLNTDTELISDECYRDRFCSFRVVGEPTEVILELLNCSNEKILAFSFASLEALIDRACAPIDYWERPTKKAQKKARKRAATSILDGKENLVATKVPPQKRQEANEARSALSKARSRKIGYVLRNGLRYSVRIDKTLDLDLSDRQLFLKQLKNETLFPEHIFLGVTQIGLYGRVHNQKLEYVLVFREGQKIKVSKLYLDLSDLLQTSGCSQASTDKVLDGRSSPISPVG